MSEVKKTMKDYVEESAAVMRRNLERRVELTKELVDVYLDGAYEEVYIVASGSSYNSACCARPFLREVLKAEVKVMPPFTYEHYEAEVPESALLLTISQSGFSTNAIAALKKQRELGYRTIGLTGDTGSDLKQYCDLIIDYGVGVETVGYVTKGVTTLVEFLMLFALEAGRRKRAVAEEQYEVYVKALENAAENNAAVYEKVQEFYKKNYKTLTSMRQCFFCSSGANYGTALESALKISETVQIPAYAYEVEEYIHGPNLQLTPDYSVFLLDDKSEVSGRILDVARATEAVTDRTFLITGNEKAAIDEKRVLDLSGLKACDPLTAPLYYLPAVQYLAYQITEDLHRWKKHPLFEKFEEIVKCKTENYVDKEN